MPLEVKLTVVPKEDAIEQTKAMQARGDIPDGIVIEDKASSTEKKRSQTDQEGFSDEPATAKPRQSISKIPPEQQQEEEEEEELSPCDKEDQSPTDPRDDNECGMKELKLDESNATLNSATSNSKNSNGSIGKSPTSTIHDPFYAMKIATTGKFSRKATLQDIARFAKLEKMDSEGLIGWLRSYLEQNFPKQLEKPNCIPRSAHIQDDPKKGFDAFDMYGWKPVKLQLQPGLIDVKEQSTKQVQLEEFTLSYETDLEQALKEKGDKEVVSYLRKSQLAGHPLAVEVFQRSKKSQDAQVITEFRNVDSVVFRLGHNQCPSETDPDTGDTIWKDSKKLRALLHDQKPPTKTGKGVTRTVQVLALESAMKARVYYKANFTGSVSTDHGHEQFDGRRFWNWDLKYLLRYNGIPNAIVVYQDIELKFYSRIQYAMENEDWEWVNRNGTWVKQKL